MRLETLEPRLVLDGAALPADIVSWYRAEGDAADFAGTSDGTLLNGATFTAGKVGQAFLFDGVDDQVVVDDNNNQDPGSQFTVEAWVNPSSSGHGRPIAQKRAGSTGYTFETTHAPYAPNDGLQFVAWIGGSQHFLQTPEGVLTNNAWQHVAATYDGLALRIYVDGVEQASAPASGAIDDSDADVVIGQNVVIPSFAWQGAIDEVSFYSRALTQAEIQTVVDAGSEGKRAAIVVTTAADEDDGSANENLGAGTSLREAIHFANANPGTDAIAFSIPRPSTTDLVSWWRAEGSASDSIDANDGTLQNGATLAAGRYGQAFDLNGEDDFVEVPDAANLDGMAQLTVDAWVKFDALPNGKWQWIVSKASVVGVGSNSYSIWLAGDTMKLTAAVETNLGLITLNQGLETFTDTTSFHHVALTYDGAAARFFVDGVLKQSAPLSGSVLDTTYPLFIGRRAETGSDFRNDVLSGLVDEVGIASRALSAAEIQAIASGQRTIRPSLALPAITSHVIIDGYMQPGASPNSLADGNDAVILIELDGTNASDGASGLVLAGGGSTIRGLAINRFSDSGIELRSGANVIEGNFLGTDVTGTQDLGNQEGVTIIGPEELDAIYANDFDSDPGEEWSNNETDETPIGGQRFLGQFSSETVTLSLDADSIDQDIDVMTVAFDLFVIRTWDGNHAVAGSGPDRFTLTLGDGTTLLDTTFSNGHPNSAAAGQAFPGDFGTGQFDPRTDAAENNTLGFTFPGVDVMDSVYRLSFAFPYTGGDLVLNFTGALTSSLDDESWALDNVVLIEGERPASVQGNRIGGTSPAEQNIVAYSSGDGIRTDGDNIAAVIIGNSIFASGADGIDFDDQIVDAPEILAITSFPGELKFEGSLDSVPSRSYRIEMFASDGAIESNDDEGQRLLGVRQVTTDASGHITFIHELPPVADGQWITATATLVDGDGEALLATSEFSEAVQVGSATLADVEVSISDSPDPVLIGDSVTYTVTVTNHGPVDATGAIVVAHGQLGQPFNSLTLPVGGLANGESSSFQLVFTPAVLGSFSIMATATANEEDPILANNTFTETTQVIPRLKFELAQAHYEVREGEPFAILTVRRTGDLESSGRVEFTTVNGTAGQRGIQAGLSRVDDFTTTSGELFFRSRSNVATIRVPIGDDGRLEPDESFRVVLSNPSAGAELGAITSAEVIIHDNDPTVQFVASSQERSEAVTSRTQIEVNLHPASNQTVTVAYAVGGGSATPGIDFTLIGTSLIFRPGETRKFINFSNINDTLFEGNETAFIELVSATNAFLGVQNRHRVTIVDNDPVPPPVDPGGTLDAALSIDLATLPRQSYRHFVVRTNGGINDIDMFRAYLDGGEAIVLDVDPEGNQAVGMPGIGNSTLTVFGSDGVTPDIRQLASANRSAEPDTGVFTNNAALLFRAPAAGDYYFQLQTNVNGLFGYRLHFHRLGVSDNVPSPELLNVPGPMFAWFDAATSTVGITGPTGYGFTLEGPWLQQTTFNRRSGLWSQTLTMNSDSRFTMRSPQGVELPLLANGPIFIRTKANRFGNIVGVVDTANTHDAISFPVAIDIVPLNNLLADAFGSSFATVGLLAGDWRISMGGDVFNVAGTMFDDTDKIGQLLPGVPYLRRFGNSLIDTRLGGLSLDYNNVPVHWIFDPADPMLLVKVPPVPQDPRNPGPFKKGALGASLHGLLRFAPQDPPDPEVDAGVTEFAGHLYATAKVALKIGPVPVDVEADIVLNVDADRDGRVLGDLGDVADVFNVIQGDFSEIREILDDIQLGANGTAVVAVPAKKPDGQPGPKMEAGRASVVLNGLTETVWIRGQQGGKAFPDSPIEIGGGGIVWEGLIDFNGPFFFAMTTSSNAAGIELAYKFTVSNEGISARITGKASWDARIDYGVGTVSGKAIAEIEANIAIEIDDDGDVHLSGSISASGRLRYQGRNLFEGSIEASVRSRGFRFRFPRGVGNIDLDLFN